MKYLLLYVISGFIFFSGFAQQSKDSHVLKLFQSISATPKDIVFLNSMEVNNSEGHLQGIQLVKQNDKRFAVMTGSSDSYAYYTVVKLGGKNEVLSVNHLMEKPFKHAGGFQVYRNYMAVGIEDNSAKDKSWVCIYDIASPERPSVKPLAMIKREGAPLLSTAGCVGISGYKGRLIVVVGDWDSKNLDFYSCMEDDVAGGNFKKIHSINMSALSKTGWSDPNWRSYQNINLFTLENQLYFIGFGRDERKVDVADLYSLDENITGDFGIVKLASKTFSCTHDVSFMAGAGAFLSPDGFRLISCEFNMGKVSYLNIFDKK